MKIGFVGDISLGEYYLSFGHGPRTYIENGNNPFSEVNEFFNDHDIMVGNLEACLSDINLKIGEPESEVLRGSPKSIELLKEANFKVLQVSNNHMVQHGKECFEDTVNNLNLAGIEVVGLNNQDVLILEISGMKVGFLAASDVPDNTYPRQNLYQKLDKEFINRVHESVSKVDHLFVMLHWGLESETSPMEYQMVLKSEFERAGVRGIIGTHPHLFYEVSSSESMVFAPSLGDFIFDLNWDYRYKKSGILSCYLENDELTSEILPIAIHNDGCVPKVAGEKVTLKLNEVTEVYDLGAKMNNQQLKKNVYFFKKILSGNKKLKFMFFLRKLGFSKFFPNKEFNDGSLNEN